MNSIQPAMALCAGQFAAFRLVEFHSNPKFFLRPRNGSSVLSGDDRRRMGKRNSAGVECETGSKPSADCCAVVVALATA